MSIPNAIHGVQSSANSENPQKTVSYTLGCKAPPTRRSLQRRGVALFCVWFVLFYCFFLCFFSLCVFGVRFVSCVCVCVSMCSFVLRNFEVHDSANAENPIIKHRGVLWCVLCGCVAFLFCGFVLLLLDLACLM